MNNILEEAKIWRKLPLTACFASDGDAKDILTKFDKLITEVEATKKLLAEQFIQLQYQETKVHVLTKELEELKINRTEVWAVQDLLAQADKRYAELIQVKNSFATKLAASEQARKDAEEKLASVIQLVKDSRP